MVCSSEHRMISLSTTRKITTVLSSSLVLIFLLSTGTIVPLPTMVSGLSSRGDGDMAAAKTTITPSFDSRGTLSREDAREVYDKFAEKDDTVAGNDVESGYGGPAVTALLQLAEFDKARKVLEYGCGQGKLVELVFSKIEQQRRHHQDGNENGNGNGNSHRGLSWRGIDQSPQMIRRFLARNKRNLPDGGDDNRTSSSSFCTCTGELLESGDPKDVEIVEKSYDRFVSTYCLDLLSEEDVFRVLDLAERSLETKDGRLLLAGITWGYRSSVQTFFMTAIWELLYRVYRKKVGGCRPQLLQPYLESKGWRIEKIVKTLPDGYPWMVSEVISARPPTE